MIPAFASFCMGAKSTRTLPKALAYDTAFALVDMLVTASLLLAFIPKNDNTLRRETVAYVICAVAISVSTPLNRVPEFTNSLVDGTFVRYHIRPQRLFSQFLSYELGALSIRMLSTSILFLASLFITGPTLANLIRIPAAILAATMGGVLAASIAVSFYVLTAFTRRDSGPKALLQGFSALLSGQLLPLDFWPGASVWIHYQPFAYVADQPVRVALGTANLTNVLVTQALWSALFICIGASVAEKHFRLRESVGS